MTDGSKSLISARIREADIRPPDLLDEYLRLSAADARHLLECGAARRDRSCPACAQTHADIAFHKNGFALARCPRCDTLYAVGCLDDFGLAALYTTSASAQFWANVFMPAVSEARRERIFRPRAARTLDLAARHLGPFRSLIDVGAGNGMFLDEIGRLASDLDRRAVEPGPSASQACRRLGLATFEGFAVDAARDPAWAGSADLVTCFEVIEHVPDPAALLRDLAALVRPGGLLLVTGLCGTGFDIVTLGPRSKAVWPPHHINFLSRRGVTLLLQRVDLVEEKFLTPGVLDVEIVANALKTDPTMVVDPFLRRLLVESDPAVRDKFQSFLAEAELSSHMWIVARRPSAS